MSFSLCKFATTCLLLEATELNKDLSVEKFDILSISPIVAKSRNSSKANYHPEWLSSVDNDDSF